MTAGYIFECGPDGGDMKVFRWLNERICPGSVFKYEALSVKTTLLRDCGKAARSLKAQGCDRIFIVWDLYPAWREDKGAPCRHEDKEAIKRSLQAYGLTEADVVYLCLEEELEAWLIADGRALCSYFSKPHRKVDNIKNESRPDDIPDPKGRLTGYFKQYKHVPYEGNIHAEQIIKRLTDFKKLKKSENV